MRSTIAFAIRRRRSVAAVLVAVFQLALAFAPLAERPEYRLGAHVEQQGDERDHGHEGDCVSCAANRLSGASHAAAAHGLDFVKTAPIASSAVHVAAVNREFSFSQPRAPPLG